MKTKSEKKIKVLKDGPYEVSENIPLNQLRYVPNEKGASLGYEEIAGFIEAVIIDLMDEESLCGVARFCDTNGSTWNLVENDTL